MDDNELLKAIAQIVQSETKPINERLDGMDKRFDALDVRLDGMDKRLEAVEDRLGGVENELTDVKERVTYVETKTDRLQLLLEHDIPKQISILAEGHTALLKHMATSEELGGVDSRVHTLETVVARHSDDIAALKRAAN